ncbi:uncharacterized protein RAG0_07024 [Rhynchosporium agropyri]|uniref:Tim44-like domain-containing protein n=1 Tax=Rhynchosporium agropyri TaxID=914238 RepID=A0A1E1KMU6_9HELO|nr:uncharacterized protein RAG0_07024 [Rhynchosporium agropyri]
MAQLIPFRRPLPVFRALRVTCSQPRIQRQCFSQTSLLLASNNINSNKIMGQRPRQAAEPSRKVLMKQNAQIPSDVGLLDCTLPSPLLTYSTTKSTPTVTFITPTGRNVPSPFGSPKTYLKLRIEHLKTRLRDRFSLFVLWVSSPSVNRKFFTRAIKIQRSAIAPTAVALHRQMYTLFAEGQLAALRKMCTDGIYQTFQSRIERRRKGEKVVWELVKYNGGPKLVSHRGAKIPMDGAAIRQAVVRIRSTQRLTRWVNGKQVEGTGKERDVTEYVVLQRMTQGWEEGGWMVWGTTEETTVEELKKWDEKKALE